MKVIDLEFEDVKYNIDKKVPDGIKNVRFYQKELFLCIAGEIVPLDVDSVSDTAFYLKIGVK